MLLEARANIEGNTEHNLNVIFIQYIFNRSFNLFEPIKMCRKLLYRHFYITKLLGTIGSASLGDVLYKYSGQVN